MGTYIAHLVRGQVEAKAKAARRSQLKPEQVEVTLDYKMKWTALLLKECQLEWFGKAGIAWHGAMFIRCGCDGRWRQVGHCLLSSFLLSP